MIELHESNDAAAWDELLVRFKGSPYLSSGFLTAIVAANQKPLFLQFFEGNECVGMIAGVVDGIGSGILRREGSIFLSYSGLVTQDEDPQLEQRCLQALQKYGKSAGWYFFNLLGYDNPRKVKNSSFRWCHQLQEYFIDLRLDENQILLAAKPKVRQTYRKTAKTNIRIELCAAGSGVDELVQLLNFTKNRRISKGSGDYNYFYLPGLTQDVIQKICLNRVGQIYLTFVDDVLCVASFVLLHGTRAVGLLRGSNDLGYASGANAFAALSSIFMMKQIGCLTMNTGGVATNDAAGLNLHAFKQSLGYRVQECDGGVSDFLQSPLHKMHYRWVR